jgi:hypothetical protein
MLRLRCHTRLVLITWMICCPVGYCQAQVVHDSAGVHAVRFPALAQPPTVWRVDLTPILQLGAHSHGGPEEFSRIVGVVRLNNGTIVVADNRNELRYFSADGAFLLKAGRTGEGPGEFRNLSNLFLVGDTVVATGLTGLSARFSSRGLLLGTIPRPRSFPGSPQLLGYFSNGSAAYLVQHPYDQRATSGVVTVFGTVYNYKFGKTEVVTTLLEHVPLTATIGTQSGPRPAIFHPRRLLALSASGLCTVYNDKYALSCMNFDGRHPVQITWDKPPLQVTESIKSAFKKAIAAHPVPGEGGRGVKKTGDLLFAQSLPVVALIRRTSDNEVWVQSYSMDVALMSAGNVLAPSQPTDWTVFAPDGKMLAAVQLPPRFVPFNMGRDYVLGVVRDKDDVELVTLLRVNRQR